MAEKKTTPSVPKYSVDELAHNVQALFGVKPEVFYGALHGIEQKELTVDEARRLIEQFLKRRVK